MQEYRDCELYFCTPTWSSNPDCRDKAFTVPNVTALDTTNLHGAAFDWCHYGAPLALLRLCRFVRVEILKDDRPPCKVVPIPGAVIYQIGNLIVTKVDEIPADAARVDVERRPDCGISLPGGYVIGPVKRDCETS